MQRISNTRYWLRMALWAFAATTPWSAQADPYHYNNMLIGDRAAGLGGAYTAISDDPTGLLYNPAGIVYASGSTVNGSMNAWQTSSTKYHDVFGSKSWQRQSSSLVPNFFGVMQPFAGGMVGFSYALTDVVLEDQDQEFRDLIIEDGNSVDKYYINFNNQDTVYNIGPSFAYKIKDNVSVGITLYGHYRSKKQVWNQQIYYTSGQTRWHNQYLQGTEFGIKPVLGVMWSPMDRLSLGASVRKTKLLRAQTRLQYTDKLINQTALPTPTVGESDAKRDLPLQINLGAAYFASDRLLFTGDVSYFEAVASLRQINNFAAGCEYYFSSQWALRGGLFTNNSNTPALREGQAGQLEHVDLYGFSTSITHFTRNSALTGGLSASTGSGEAQVLSETTSIQKLTMNTATIFISATYSY